MYFVLYFDNYVLIIDYLYIYVCVYVSHLVSKAGSVISSKSPSPVFRWSGI